MSIDENAMNDLPLDDKQAEAVAGGAVELGDGAGEEAHGEKRARARRSASGADLGANRYQVLRNDRF